MIKSHFLVQTGSGRETLTGKGERGRLHKGDCCDSVDIQNVGINSYEDG